MTASSRLPLLRFVAVAVVVARGGAAATLLASPSPYGEVVDVERQLLGVVAAIAVAAFVFAVSTTSNRKTTIAAEQASPLFRFVNSFALVRALAAVWQRLYLRWFVLRQQPTRSHSLRQSDPNNKNCNVKGVVSHLYVHPGKLIVVYSTYYSAGWPRIFGARPTRLLSYRFFFFLPFRQTKTYVDRTHA